MARRVNPDAIATARMLLVNYYESGKQGGTYDSIARRARVSRSTVARLARKVREVLPTVSELLERIETLELRVAVLEATHSEDEVEERSRRWAT
jgi:DNA invertase Pin-like site-specific DNA recombinase